jgi:hypothetical protein
MSVRRDKAVLSASPTPLDYCGAQTMIGLGLNRRAEHVAGAAATAQ